MSERPREDDGTTRSSSDPYGYLTAGDDGDTSYLPGDVESTRSRERTDRGPGAVDGADRGTAAEPVAPEPEAHDEDEVTVGMTRRELRERRARRAERAAAAASVPVTAAEVPDDDTATSGTAGDDVPPVPAAPAPTWGAVREPGAETERVVPAALDAQDRPAGDELDARAADEAALTPGWHDPQARTPGRGRGRVLWIVLAVLAVAAIAVTALLLANRDEDTAAQPSPTASEPAPTGLAALIPTTVEGGEFSEGGPTGVTYRIDEQGLVDNPLPPAGAAESLTALYTGGTADVTLTASTFATADEATAAATEAANQLGTPVDTGVVFPDTGLGTYWTFNNDGLVTVVWHAGADGAYVVVSEDAEDALGFYNGLEF